MTCSNERKIQIYARPRIFMMFMADCSNRLRSESSHGDDILAKHYESLSENQQKDLLRQYEKMTKP